jgi:delta 1-pyrroline-5-carboxylate dehydrogenase
VQGRNTQGVKIMNVGEKDKVVGVATLAKEEEAAEAVQEKLEEAGTDPTGFDPDKNDLEK